MAYNFGLLWLIYGLLWGTVAHYFGLLGVPGNYRVCRVSIVGIVIMFLGRYLLVGYLDPWGNVNRWLKSF